MTKTTRQGSTGGHQYDKEAAGTHECVLDEDVDVIIIVPGEIPQQRITVNGVSYTHVREDREGRWVYARL